MTSLHDELPDGRLKRFEQWMDRHKTNLLRGAFVIMFLVSVASAYGVWKAFNDFKQESLARRSQSCKADEREHKDKVDALKQTYLILGSQTSRAQLGPGLVRAIVVNLPMTEKAARTDQAPEYCDEPGIGLPEPDPVPPKRRDFSYLLAPSNDPP